MIRDYFDALRRALRKTQQLLSLMNRMEKSGGKCDRYQKKTVFDILGVTYDRHQKPLAA